MKRFALVASACVLLGLSCTVLEDYQVRVELTGDAGIEFSGWYTTALGVVDTVSGTIPDHWTVPVKRTGDMVTAFFSKENQPGTMIGRMIVDGDTIQEKTAPDPTDALSMHWEP